MNCAFGFFFPEHRTETHRRMLCPPIQAFAQRKYNLSPTCQSKCFAMLIWTRSRMYVWRVIYDVVYVPIVLHSFARSNIQTVPTHPNYEYAKVFSQKKKVPRQFFANINYIPRTSATSRTPAIGQTDIVPDSGSKRPGFNLPGIVHSIYLAFSWFSWILIWSERPWVDGFFPGYASAVPR